jgi:hypothetical protein
VSPERIGGHEPRRIIARFDKPDATDKRVPPVRRAYASFNDIALPIRRDFDSCDIMLDSMLPECRDQPFPFLYSKTESLENYGLVPSIAVGIGKQVIDDLFLSDYRPLEIRQLHGVVFQR